MTLRDQIERIRSAIVAGQFVNEASVCTGIVLPILHELGWPIFDPQIVRPEHTIANRRVDYALCHPRGKPAVFIEVKQTGKSEGADRQLFEYAFHEGVPIAVLTDGQEWHFYLPAGQGQYHERRVYRLDVLGREASESEERLRRYLGYSAICSGEARRAAADDYEGVRRDREIADTIPVAWSKLLQEREATLVDLLSDQVEALCGFKPDVDTVAQFISEQPRTQSTSASPNLVKSHSGSIGPAGTATRRKEPASNDVKAGFVLDGVKVGTRSAIDTLIKLLQALATRDDTFLTRFVALPRHGRSRRFVGRSPAELYPDRDDLARDYTHQLLPGWWVGTNYSSDQIEKIIKMACQVAGMTVGKDVAIEIPRRERSA